MRKSKAVILVILVIGIVVGAIPMSACAGAPKGKFAAGATAIFPVLGLSGKYYFTDKIGGELILGIVGDVNIYGIRGLYKIMEEEDYDLYGAILAGQWIYRYEEYYWEDWELKSRTATESAFGFGVYGGMEYFLLPELGVSMEFGLGSVTLEKYTWATITYGVGVHYYF